MKERPILFTAPMVRALLNGRKTQTRRLFKGRPVGQWHLDKMGIITSPHPKRGRFGQFIYQDAPMGKVWDIVPSPFGGPGDRLWVKETWKPCFGDGSGTAYRAERVAGSPEDMGPWKSPLFMTRKRSRITLEITAVWVERLNDISEAAAIAEGVQGPAEKVSAYEWLGNAPTESVGPGKCRIRPHGLAFMRLWEAINGKNAWALNPWVWVIEFKRVQT